MSWPGSGSSRCRTNRTLLGDALSAADIEAIAAVARQELAIAFEPFRVTLTDHRDARYSVRVVQELIDQRTKRKSWIAGQSYATQRLAAPGRSASSTSRRARCRMPRRRDPRGTDRGDRPRHRSQRRARIRPPVAAGHDEHPTKDTGSYEYCRPRDRSSTSARCIGTWPDHCWQNGLGAASGASAVRRAPSSRTNRVHLAVRSRPSALSAAICAQCRTSCSAMWNSSFRGESGNVPSDTTTSRGVLRSPAVRVGR